MSLFGQAKPSPANQAAPQTNTAVQTFTITPDELGRQQKELLALKEIYKNAVFPRFEALDLQPNRKYENKETQYLIRLTAHLPSVRYIGSYCIDTGAIMQFVRHYHNGPNFETHHVELFIKQTILDLEKEAPTQMLNYLQLLCEKHHWHVEQFNTDKSDKVLARFTIQTKDTDALGWFTLTNKVAFEFGATFASEPSGKELLFTKLTDFIHYLEHQLPMEENLVAHNKAQAWNELLHAVAIEASHAFKDGLKVTGQHGETISDAIEHAKANGVLVLWVGKDPSRDPRVRIGAIQKTHDYRVQYDGQLVPAHGTEALLRTIRAGIQTVK